MKKVSVHDKKFLSWLWDNHRQEYAWLMMFNKYECITEDIKREYLEWKKGRHVWKKKSD